MKAGVLALLLILCQIAVITAKEVPRQPTKRLSALHPSVIEHLHIRDAPKPPLKGHHTIPIRNAANSTIHVHLVPHSHDDVGWLVTPEEYYSYLVRYILDSTITALLANPSRKFIQVEQYFLHRWWTDPTVSQSLKDAVPQLLKSKQLEIILGGWVMPDEACPTYSALIDQMTEGHRFLATTFNVTPTIGYQIDPFGASTTLASINAMAGFEHHVLDRIQTDDKTRRASARQLEFIWRSSPSNIPVNGGNSIFTHILPVQYCFPMEPFFDFEVDAPAVTAENVQAYSLSLLEYIATIKDSFLTPHILVLYGCDFHYSRASLEYDSMDLVLNFINANLSASHGVDIAYSTLSEYFTAVDNYYSGSEWPVDYEGDFLPYNDDEWSWWTGYFTSRPGLKGLVRRSEARLRLADAVALAANGPASLEATFGNLTILRRALAVAQHHDAVAGTERQLVAEDYARHLSAGENATLANVVAPGLSSLLTKSSSPQPLLFLSEQQAFNALKAHQAVAVVISNSLAWNRSEVVRMAVPWPNVLVSYVPAPGAQLVQTAVQISSTWEHNAAYTLWFQVDIPAFTAVTYFLTLNNTSIAHPPELRGVLKNEYLSFVLGKSSDLKSVTNLVQQITTPLYFSHLAYDSTAGLPQPSGAYIFRSTGYPSTIPGASKVLLSEDGWLMSQVQLQTSNFTSHTLRLFKTLPYLHGAVLEIESTIGPLPGNKEVIARFTSGIKSAGAWVTDDNGLERLTRFRRPSLPDFGTFLPDVISANYYPAAYTSALNDSTMRLGFAFDRTHGVSSQADGSFEVMLHRRLSQDDFRGVSQALDDTSVITTLTRLSFESQTQAPPQLPTNLEYYHSYMLNYPLEFSYVTGFGTLGAYLARFETQASFLRSGFDFLTNKAHVVSYKLLSDQDGTILLRLGNVVDRSESDGAQCSASVNLAAMFACSIKSVTETSITTIHTLKELSPSQWSALCIEPKQIRTFLVRCS